MAIFNFIRFLFENTDNSLELCLVIKLMTMRSKVQLLFWALLMCSCSKEMDVLDRAEAADREPYFRKRIIVSTKEDKVFLKLILPKDSKPLKEAQYFITFLGKKEEA